MNSNPSLSLKRGAFVLLLVSSFLTEARAGGPALGCIVLPSATNAVQFRLYTNASMSSAHLFNTFDLEGYGEVLLRSPETGWLGRSPSHVVLHSILIDGDGPKLAPTNQMTMIEQASGPAWSYVGVDVTAAYGGRVNEYKRKVLFVEPDLFVLFDHIVAREPAKFQMQLQAPATAQVDPVWHDLRWEGAKGAFRIHAPGTKKAVRAWERSEPVEGPLVPGTVMMKLGPTNSLAVLDLVTVFAVHPAGEKKDYAFKLLESNNAIGARIHREGYPTLVAFKTDAGVTNASLTGFGFTGPVGVDVFKPKQRPR